MTEFKNNIKHVRYKLCLTQKELAKKLKVARSTIALYETGRRKPNFIILQRIIKLSNKYNIEFEIL